jgi:formylglycine-generating enzyme required for sulfatase activity
VLKYGIPKVAAKLSGAQPGASAAPSSSSGRSSGPLFGSLARDLTNAADRALKGPGSSSIQSAPQENAAALPAGGNVTGMAEIKGGCFQMGSAKGEKDEKPIHEVCVNNFSLDRTEVTQEEFQKTMGSNPSRFPGCPRCPAEQVTWEEARVFCEKAGKRLPTEAEWEFAARAGSSSPFYWGTPFSGEYAWYSDNSGGRPHPAAQKKPNTFGLHDMIGNVYEWCFDWYGKDYYRENARENPVGPASGSQKVLRGGAWNYFGSYRTCSHRHKEDPAVRKDYVGFRCAK